MTPTSAPSAAPEPSAFFHAFVLANEAANERTFSVAYGYPIPVAFDESHEWPLVASTAFSYGYSGVGTYSRAFLGTYARARAFALASPFLESDAGAYGATIACAERVPVLGSVRDALAASVRTTFPTTYAGLLRVALPHRAFFCLRQRLGRCHLRDHILG